MSVILIVDDDHNIVKILKNILGETGSDVLTAFDAESALSLLSNHQVDLVVTDLKMPGKSGMDILTTSRRKQPATPIIMMSAYGNIEDAVAAMKNGAYDFISKPFDEDEILSVVRKALSESLKNKELISPYFDEADVITSDIVGNAKEMRQILQMVNKIGPTDSTVLISGETGVGKELVAKALHIVSARRDKPFVKVNCAAIPESLLESDLFGYEKGAFTGAVTSKPGRFEIAHRGTIFLDEIGEMPVSTQAKLLGVLQDKTFEHVGGVKTIRVDIRIIAATNRDLLSASKDGSFRADLFYRLNVVPIHVPSLRDRKEDIIPLAEYFVKRLGSKYHKPFDIPSEIMAALMRYDWPGNIRELENVIERLFVLSEGDILDPIHLPEEIKKSVPQCGGDTFKSQREEASCAAEKRIIMDALAKTGQNRTRAAELLGISRRTLQNKIKDYGL